jgi:galactokinase
MNIHELFESTLGGEPTWVAHAPGRINLIGEHTDYHEGFVFPAAINHGVTVAARVSPSGISRVFSQGWGEWHGDKEGGKAVLPPHSWQAYALGTVELIGGVPPLEMVAMSDLPAGAGLSSSAATEVAFSLVFTAAKGMEMDPLARAKLCQRSENEVVGVPCGLMDQFASVFGQADHALHIDIRTTSITPTPIPAAWSLIALQSGEHHQLGDSGYPLWRRQSEEGARRLGVPFLRDATLAQVESLRGDDLVYRRCRHIVSENLRVSAFREALIAGDADRVGELMLASHASMRDDYEITTPRLDLMVEVGSNHPACIGIRMTGGGFGGACVALVWKAREAEFIRDFELELNLPGNAMPLRPSAGARVL